LASGADLARKMFRFDAAESLGWRGFRATDLQKELRYQNPENKRLKLA